MKGKITILTLLLTSFFLLNADATSEAEEMCKCMKEAKASNKKADKKKCLDLREKQVKKIGKSSPEYSVYTDKLSECERELMGVTPADTTLSFEEKVKQVCACFTSGKARPACFQMQDQYAKTISDLEKKKEFNLSTGSCDK